MSAFGGKETLNQTGTGRGRDYLSSFSSERAARRSRTRVDVAINDLQVW